MHKRAFRGEPENSRGIESGNTGLRISVISGRLYSIRGQFVGTRGPAKLLVDSGASINLIKNSVIQKSHPKQEKETGFSMGNEKHQTRETVILTFQNKEHKFVVVPDDFPLPEDGIIGNPFLHSYTFKLTNRSLHLDDEIYVLEDDGITIKKNTVKIITLETEKKEGHVIIENNRYLPDAIHCIRDSQIKIPICNESEN